AGKAATSSAPPESRVISDFEPFANGVFRWIRKDNLDLLRLCSEVRTLQRDEARGVEVGKGPGNDRRRLRRWDRCDGHRIDEHRVIVVRGVVRITRAGEIEA